MGLVAIASGRLVIGDSENDCYVLSNGARVLVTKQLEKLLGFHSPGKGHFAAQISRISREFKGEVTPATPAIKALRFDTGRGGGGQATVGLDSELIVDVCLFYQRAFLAGALHESQTPMAQAAMALLGAFAKTGLRAAIDEAAGYQALREDDDLRRYLGRVLRAEMAEWSLCFDAEWDKAFCVLYQQPYESKPPLFMRAVNAKLYETLFGEEAVTEMQRRNPRPARGRNHHQMLTPEARRTLAQHIPTFLGVAKTCRTPREFWHKIDVIYRGSPLQTSFWAA